MKIERINDNQIRCTLTSFDLSVRNLNLGELAYGSEKARGLFREMIQKASNEVGFEAEDIPLMVEAIPLSNESIMLVITKIEDPEELDTRFSKFSPSTDVPADMLTNLASELLEGADGLSKLLGEHLSSLLSDNTLAGGDGDSRADSPSLRIYSFNSLDMISEAARAVKNIFDGVNTLYKKPDTSQYYLVIKNDGSDSLAFSRACNVLAEYGTKIRQEYASEAYYVEHYEVICQDKALQVFSSF
ncbi:MAG: adaptor protein MecA [Hungatella sp.]|jgi:adapter protein MecA 1/2|nr:adaptor protein MecA [Hungatella sp.]